MGSFTVRGIQVTWMDHATVKLMDELVTYIDPFADAIHTATEQADLIVVTHPHPDHFDPDAVNKLAFDDTTVIAKGGCDIGQLDYKAIIMEPGQKQEIYGVDITGVQAYNDHRFRNPGEPFHPQGHGMGIILEIDNTRFYHAGDTDYIGEMDALATENIDVAFLPIGGTYTMDWEEAVEAAKAIQPRIVVPIHYNMIQGTDVDPFEFKRQVEADTNISVRILEPER